MGAKSENRVKILSVDPRLLIDLFNWQRNPTSRFTVRAPIVEPIPKDVEILSVNANWNVRRIDLLICHSSFEQIPLGQEPPLVVDFQNECRIVTLQKNPDV